MSITVLPILKKKYFKISFIMLKSTNKRFSSALLTSICNPLPLSMQYNYYIRGFFVCQVFYEDFSYNTRVDEIIAKRIRDIRIDNKLTQKQFGDMLSVSQDTVSLWENRKSLPTAEYIIAICKTFSVSADYLLGLSEY